MEDGCDYSRVYSSRGCCWSTGGTESGQACEKRLVKSGKNTLKNAIVEGTMDGSLEALSGGDFKRGFERAGGPHGIIFQNRAVSPKIRM